MTLFILLYVFASFGFAFVVGYSKISLHFRKWLSYASELHLAGDKIEDADVQGYSKPVRFAAKWLLALLECPACLAFWLGAAAALTTIDEAIPLTAPHACVAVLLGLANCGVVLALGLLTRLIRTE